MSELKKFFEPQQVESKWYEYWLENKHFQPSADKSKPAYSIVIPPPNVTGSLHMGHALNVTLQDILSRWKRMKGYRVLWVPGMDHAGIATQNVVERHLAKEKIDRHSIGRDKFIEKVWNWKKEYGGFIIHQLKKLGASCDWSMERFTLDEGLSSAVREVFVRLYNENLIYRSLRLINWCPRCSTALSDLEVEHEETQGELTYIRYPMADNSSHVVVATTRPETMLGDTAVAVNPNDKRHIDSIGKKVKLPLTTRTISIIADSEVDPEFGTGAVKVTPAHDFNDEAIAKRQSPNLPFVKVIGDDAIMTGDAGSNYAGIDRYECREKVIADLSKNGLIEKQEPHKHAVGHCYRCKTVIEPLPTVQWYMDVQKLAVEATDSVKNGSIKIIPGGWNNSYYVWMKNIKDWCISRQIWWGHRIPIWYCADCKNERGVIQGEKIYHTLLKSINGISEGTYRELRNSGLTHEEIIKHSNHMKVDLSVRPMCESSDIAKCPKCGSINILRDPDVLDTWFSSALWPFSTLGWPDDSDDIKSYYPTSVLVTGFDILFFWVARMIMMGLKFMNSVPFRDVYIHALVRDSKGQKMSKSKGNVVDPLLMIDKYGTDAFRFTLAAFAVQGRDVRFSEERVEGYRHFVNKLWNAARFILMATGNESDTTIIENRENLNLPDKWILSRLAQTAEEANRALSDYRFNDASSALYQFIWHEFCDWYIELAKTILNSDKKKAQNGDKEKQRDPEATKSCLLYVLNSALRLLHPFMPFITEEIWHTIPHEGDTISLKDYPDLQKDDGDSAEKDLQPVIDAISGIRSIKGELNISPSKTFSASIKTFTLEVKRALMENRDFIMGLARLSSLEIGESIKKTDTSAVSVKNDMEVYVPLSGLLNVETEVARLEKELKKIEDSLGILDKKLFNEDFLNRAPKSVVEKEKLKYDELTSRKERIVNNISKIKQLEEN